MKSEMAYKKNASPPWDGPQEVPKILEGEELCMGLDPDYGLCARARATLGCGLGVRLGPNLSLYFLLTHLFPDQLTSLWRVASLPTATNFSIKAFPLQPL